MLIFLLTGTWWHNIQGNICILSSVFTYLPLSISELHFLSLFLLFVQLVSTAHVYICFEQLSSKFK